MNYFDSFLLIQLFLLEAPNKKIGTVSKLKHLNDTIPYNWTTNLHKLLEAELIDEDYELTSKGRALATSKLEAGYMNKYNNVSFDKLLAGKSAGYQLRLLQTILDKLNTEIHDATSKPFIKNVQNLGKQLALYGEEFNH